MRQEAEEETHRPTGKKMASVTDESTAQVQDGTTDKWAIIGK